MTSQSGSARMSITLLMFFNNLPLKKFVRSKAIYKCTDLAFVGVCVLHFRFLLVNLASEQCILQFLHGDTNVVY